MRHDLEGLKSEQACAILKELGIDAWLVWVRETSQMADPVLKLILGNDLVWQSALLYTKKGQKTAIVGNFDADAVENTGIFDHVIPYTKGIREDLLSQLDGLAPKSIAINYSKTDVSADGMSVGMHILLKELLEGTTYQTALISAEELVGRLRGRKIPEEIDRIQKAVDITESIFDSCKPFVRVGMSEQEVHRFFHDMMLQHGVTCAWQEDHNPAVDAGPDKKFGHSGPTDNKIKSGHLLHFDFGVRWTGYCSDIQRMFFFGSKSDVPEEITTAFNTVRDAIQKASTFIKHGRKGHEVDEVARTYVTDHGYEEYQHALGHQLGRLAHDGGTLLGPLWERYGESPKGVVEAGNVFTLELYVTTENYGQVSLEEDIVVTKSGCTFLSRPQMELVCIE